MRTLRMLSLGAGVQSTTLALMHHEGTIEPFEHIIFADTGWEPQAVYDHLEVLEGMMEIVTVSAGDVRDFASTNRVPGQTRFAKMPLWFRGKNNRMNLLRRQCTREYKIDPIERYIKREIMGLAARKWWPKDVLLEVNLGISTDELGRVAQDAFDLSIRHILPDAESYLHRSGLPLSEADLDGVNNSSLLHECSGVCAN